MPNVITHGLMAHEVTQIIDDNKVSQAISSYPQAFFFGSNGPDFLFYYRFLSHDDDAKKMRGIGNTFHDAHINDFYTSAKKVKRNKNIIEGMACPGGCVGGAGTLVNQNKTGLKVKQFAGESKLKSASETYDKVYK